MAPEAFLNALRNKANENVDDLVSMDRIALHTLLHTVSRRSQPILALRIVEHLYRQPEWVASRKRRRIAERTMAKLFSALARGSTFSASRTRDASMRPAFSESLTWLRSSSVSGAAPIEPSKRLALMLNVLEMLGNHRDRRTPSIYEAVIQRCMLEGLPDQAAKVFVSLVEEWVTEGRIAEGAGASDFYAGGGPPRNEQRSTIPMKRTGITALLEAWWKGVRTWKLPGEVLSPHDRLDLWHPQNLSLGHRLRGFPLPIPTSPPSNVPTPAKALLEIILRGIKLDPKTVPSPEFASSMRALAMIANTVHSRILPFGSLETLVRVCDMAPSRPPIYPVGVTPPTADAWAFEAYTHIHLALQSLIFMPPLRVAALLPPRSDPNTLADRTINAIAAKQPSAHTSRYTLPPLTLRTCTALLHYGLKQLRATDLLARLLTYMRNAFGMGTPKAAVFNLLYRGTSQLRDNKAAQTIEDTVFAGTPLSRSTPASPSSSRASDPETQVSVRKPIPVLAPYFESPAPNEDSVVSLIHHLAGSSQLERLQKLVHRLLPFPSAEARLQGVTPDPLTPRVYGALLDVLTRTGQNELAHRVYDIAVQHDDQWAQSRSSLCLPVQVYTSMLRICSEELRRGKLPRRFQFGSSQTDTTRPSRRPLGQSSGFERLHDFAEQLYQRGLARITRDIQRMDRSNVSSHAPPPDMRVSADFFDALLSMRRQYWLRCRSTPTSTETASLAQTLVDLDIPLSPRWKGLFGSLPLGDRFFAVLADRMDVGARTVYARRSDDNDLGDGPERRMSSIASSMSQEYDRRDVAGTSPGRQMAVAA